MDEGPDKVTLNPEEVSATGHRMITILYEGFLSMSEMLTELKNENERLKEEKTKLAEMNEKLVNKLIGDESEES